MFFLLAVAGLEVFGVILGGYASSSKWSLYGAMREAAQVVSYEIPLALCVLVPVLLTGSMDLVEIGNRQAGWFFPNWNIFNPFAFVTFWIYATCVVASTNRAPFDLPEAESELVAGFLTEYSGFRWVIFFMAEYPSMFVVSGLGTLLFLGGWNGPVPITSWLGLDGAPDTLGGWIGNLLGLCNFIIKAVVGVTCMIWLRWTLPRLRIDQVMTTCLKYCVPLASAMMLGAMLWVYFLPGGLITQVRHSLKAVEHNTATRHRQGFQDESCRSQRTVRVVEFEPPGHCVRKGARPAIMGSINWHSCFFYLLAVIACLSAMAVVLTGNIVRMACFLVVSLGAVAGLFFLAGADFLGAVQLMVYVGGTMVLLVFGVMLTARGPFVSMKTGGGQWILATILGGACLAVLVQAAMSIPTWTTASNQSNDRPTATPLGLGLMGVRVDQLDQSDVVLRSGMSGHLLAFEIISVHLVVVLIGAA